MVGNHYDEMEPEKALVNRRKKASDMTRIILNWLMSWAVPLCSEMGYWGVFEKDKPNYMWGVWETIFRFIGWFLYPVFLGLIMIGYGFYELESRQRMRGIVWLFVGLGIMTVYFHFEQ